MMVISAEAGERDGAKIFERYKEGAETLPTVYFGFLHGKFPHQYFLRTFKCLFFLQIYTSHILDLT